MRRRFVEIDDLLAFVHKAQQGLQENALLRGILLFGGLAQVPLVAGLEVADAVALVDVRQGRSSDPFAILRFDLVAALLQRLILPQLQRVV